MKKCLILIMSIIFMATGCSQQNNTTDAEVSQEEEVTIAKTTTISREIEAVDSDWESNNPIYIDLNNPVAQTGVSLGDQQILINQPGVYALSGEYEGQIRVNLAVDENVWLVFDGVTISNSEDAPIYIESVKNCILTLAEGTVNTVSDSARETTESEASATIYSKDDLKINGEGSLIVNANDNNAIQSKDDLFILSGNIIINAVEKGLVGKDSVRIKDGNIQITSGKDSIQTTNADEADKGYVLITGGTFNLVSDYDGISAETQALITGGTFTITTGNGVEGVSQFASLSDVSTKGIKANTDLSIEGGSFTINSADDAIHSDATCTLSGGTFILSSGDDGIHAGETLTIGGGTIQITQSYEGLEGNTINILAGSINLVASDDGLNAAGGNDSSGFGSQGGFKQGDFSGGNSKINIQGGEIYVNAKGDGVDSNGSIEMSGGTLVVYGPTDSMNGTLDYDSEFVITGGTFVGIGTSGMAQTPSESSTQNTIVTNAQGNSDDSIEIKDASGTVLWCGYGQKEFTMVMFSSSNLVEGETYSIWINDTESDSVTIDGVISGTVVGNGMQGGNMRGDKGMGTRPEGMERPTNEYQKGEIPEGEMPNNNRENQPQNQ